MGSIVVIYASNWCLVVSCGRAGAWRCRVARGPREAGAFVVGRRPVQVRRNVCQVRMPEFFTAVPRHLCRRPRSSRRSSSGMKTALGPNFECQKLFQKSAAAGRSLAKGMIRKRKRCAASGMQPAILFTAMHSAKHTPPCIHETPSPMRNDRGNNRSRRHRDDDRAPVRPCPGHSAQFGDA